MIFLWTLSPENIHTLGKPFHCHLGILYHWHIINAQHQIALRSHTQHLQCFDNLQIRNFNFWMLRSLKIFLSNKNTFLEEVFIYHMTILCWHQHLCCKKNTIYCCISLSQLIQFYTSTLECPSAYHHWQSWHFLTSLPFFQVQTQNNLLQLSSSTVPWVTSMHLWFALIFAHLTGQYFHGDFILYQKPQEPRVAYNLWTLIIHWTLKL